MKALNLIDTIAAIGTSLGESGIGLVRLSGKDSIEVAEQIFMAKDGKKVSGFKAYTVHYGWLGSPGNIIDEVLLTVMRAPRSYTREDVVEISCHGGILALRRALDLVLAKGCRLAEPGEFTKRAFLNGRIDLAQSEAVLDIIRAKTESALRLGVEQLKGGLSQGINRIRDNLLNVLAILEASIDFPDEEIGQENIKNIYRQLDKLNRELQDILHNAGYGRILREGVLAVICGRPNVGKSSLLNALIKHERSIVTDIPGTTRDTIEETIDIKGIPIRIVDTAGILKPRDLIEKKAVGRSRKQMELADLVILLFDGSQKISPDDILLMRKLKDKNVLAVVNKIDLKPRLDKKIILKYFPLLVEIAAKKNKNISILEETIAKLVYSGSINLSESILVSNLRHIQILKSSQKLIAEALNSIDNSLSLEFITQDLKEAVAGLDEMLGRKFSEDLLDKIFSDFCIGK